MTTGNFRLLPISSITVAPDRQRKEMRGLSELMASINSVGLINPILVTPEYVLVAGERRFTACRDLGWTTIPVQFTSDLEPDELQLIELEENVKRVDLTWQEQCDAIARYHEMRRESDASWTMDQTATALGMSRSVVSRYLLVNEAVQEGDERVLASENFSKAHGIVERKQARRAGDASAKIAAAFTPAGEAPPPEPAAPETPIVNINWMDWAPRERVNFLHCDFPYGVNANKHNQGAADSFGGYEDGFDVYTELLSYLQQFTETHVATSAHMMFWYSMNYHQFTVNRLSDMGWKVNPFPLIWHKSDNSGIIPDPKRGPRRSYETALLCSRGDRPIVTPVANLFPHPNTKTVHMSEKPVPMLQHFFRLFVDDSTIMLDPTCGSGNSVIAAEKMGARSVTGLELSSEFATLAQENYLQQMKGN